MSMSITSLGKLPDPVCDPVHYIYWMRYNSTRSGNVFFYLPSIFSGDLIIFLETNSFSNIYWTCYEVQFECEFLIIVCEVYMLINIIN